jgi:ribulose-5-phosphate 4-epimerase/fuculose-1-phosphate aldolase
MVNHGVLICGESVANVFDGMYYLERACTAQVLAQSTGQPLRYVPEDVALRTAQQFQTERQQSANAP